MSWYLVKNREKFHLLRRDRGDDLQIWKSAVHILNKQWLTADKRWYSSFGLGRGANKFSPQNEKELACYKISQRIGLRQRKLHNCTLYEV